MINCQRVRKFKSVCEKATKYSKDGTFIKENWGCFLAALIVLLKNDSINRNFKLYIGF